MAGKSDEEYTLSESALFKQQAQDICDNLKLEPAKLDNILNGVRWALRRNPKAYPLVPKTNRLRVAKTRRVNSVPMLRIWFAVDDGKRTVQVLSVETLDVFL